MNKLIQKVFVVLFCCTLVKAQIPATPVNLLVGNQPSNVTGNSYCNPDGTWAGLKTDGPANMPISCMNTAASNTPHPGVMRGPDSTTAQVQADINAAACGDYIQVVAGSNLGAISLPPKNCDDFHWIWLASTGITDLLFPSEGTRITPCAIGLTSLLNRPAYACPTPKVLTFQISALTSGSRAVTSNGGDHYRIVGAEITRATTPGISISSLVDLTSTSTQAHHIILDRSVLHGVEGTFPATSQATDTSTTRAIWLAQSNHIAVIDSYLYDFYTTTLYSANGQSDAQCVGGGAGSIPNSGWGTYKFVNNHCEASSEGFLLGGSGGPALTPAGCTVMVNCNIDAPSDLEVRWNYFFKPPQWNGNTTVPGSTGWPVVKNGFEMKTGNRALFEGNVIENCWYNAQVCAAFSIAPVNQQSTTGTPTCPTCGVWDFTYRYNYAYGAAYGIAIYAFAPQGCAQCLSQGADRVSVHDNLIGDNLNLGNLTATSAGDEREVMAITDPAGLGRSKLQNVNFNHNTFVRGVRALVIFGGGAFGQIVNWVDQNNIWSNATYGWMRIGNGTGDCSNPFGVGQAYAMLNACVSNWTVDHNGVFNWPTTLALGANWPTDGKGANNFFFTGTASIGFANYGTGDSGFNPANYALASTSPLHNKASDGKDIGADISTLLKYINGVRK